MLQIKVIFSVDSMDSTKIPLIFFFFFNQIIIVELNKKKTITKKKLWNNTYVRNNTMYVRSTVVDGTTTTHTPYTHSAIIQIILVNVAHIMCVMYNFGFSGRKHCMVDF